MHDFFFDVVMNSSSVKIAEAISDGGGEIYQCTGSETLILEIAYKAAKTIDFGI